MDLDKDGKPAEYIKIDLLKWIIVAMIINVALSSYLLVQKNAGLNGDSFLNDACFVNNPDESNCLDVQASRYGTFLGVSVSLWGIIAFSFMAILFGAFRYSLLHGKPIHKEDLGQTAKLITYSMAFGATIAVYFVFLQFFVIDALCRYCLIIDAITFLSALAWWKHIHSNSSERFIKNSNLENTGIIK